MPNATDAGQNAADESPGLFGFLGFDFEQVSSLDDLLAQGNQIAGSLATSVGQGMSAYRAIQASIHGSPTPDSINPAGGDGGQGTPTPAPGADSTAESKVSPNFLIGLGVAVVLAVLLIKGS